MLEATAETLGITVEELFKVACFSAYCPIPNMNPRAVYQLYKDIGYIPEFVVEFCSNVKEEKRVKANSTSS